MSIKELVAGAIITVVIGGTTYTVNQADVANNLANDTGLTQQQAEKYVNEVGEDDLVPYDKLGADYITDGEFLLDSAKQTNCNDYEYEWESSTLSCGVGKSQLNEIGNNEILLGQAYKKLGSDSATKADMSSTILLIDILNSSYEFEIISKISDPATVDENKKSNSYNKAVLKAIIDGN